ncbi:hypothetical protein BO82DRAFT_133158 [Aspergillus uvarum CBS 121591]|uniref:Uncharacterized protein n=1 Tax=Aspergillus uvarum CBS 121591 TaxID=1448315 RepID=A0A319C5N5_9EURO|nr:hypothetical protein BO82DRAFT_133158 [Aspergillus uvarum CBS 121591]PYH79431.1 hypothetical protein BO82DRAFT_133158 [Aspergillus uvarum CBS 121591]
MQKNTINQLKNLNGEIPRAQEETPPGNLDHRYTKATGHSGSSTGLQWAGCRPTKVETNSSCDELMGSIINAHRDGCGFKPEMMVTASSSIPIRYQGSRQDRTTTTTTWHTPLTGAVPCPAGARICVQHGQPRHGRYHADQQRQRHSMNKPSMRRRSI